MKYVYLVIGLLLLVPGIVLNSLLFARFTRDHKRNALTIKEERFWLLCLISVGVGSALLQAAINTWNSWPMSVFEASISVTCGGIFGFSFMALWSSFYVRYYRPDLDINQKKWVKWCLISAIMMSFVSFIGLGEGVAAHLSYPLISGFSIGSNDGAWIWTTTTYKPDGGVHIAFYGIIMLFGALVTYLVCDHEFYKAFKSHGILDSMLIICFISGVIGARIGYVIGNWNGDTGGFAGFKYYCEIGQWYRMFTIWDGGITILGGLIGGALVGILFMIKRRKYVNVRWAMDVILPAVLIAQAIGRWGNFFNHEVYGVETAMSNWSFLPTWLRYQMSTSFANGVVTSTNMYVPLFLIESVINLAGFFILRYAIAKPLDGKIAKGDVGAGYLIWYGIVRLIMEPMRDPKYNMGSSGNWSIIWSILYIVIGALAVLGFELYDFYKRKHNLPIAGVWAIQKSKNGAALQMPPDNQTGIGSPNQIEKESQPEKKKPVEEKKTAEAVDAPIGVDAPISNDKKKKK